MSRKKEMALRALIDSFKDSRISGLLPDLHEYIDHNEMGLAIEMLSDWIYEHDVTVNEVQTQAIIGLSGAFGVSSDYHAFVGKKPPYPDLRSPEQWTHNKTKT